ncbi:MAG: hypothetical protein QOE97_986 [Pseudonocardiales bacterium]|nr:hypothetical protein [Pseudonocardiales bacterium]
MSEQHAQGAEPPTVPRVPPMHPDPLIPMDPFHPLDELHRAGSAAPTSASRGGEHPRRRSGQRRRLSAQATGRITFACILVAIVLAAAAGVTWVISPDWGGGNSPDAVRNVGEVPTQPGRVSLAAALVSPERIEIPRLHAVAPIVHVVTLPDNSLEVPQDPKIVGWWDTGAKPGAKTGTAILDGHINFAGVKGVLADIGTLNPGDTVYVYGVSGGKHTTVKFSITGVRTYDKHALPYQEIFDQKSVGRLAIVTCGGPFDASTGNYRDNIVAFAVPAP